MRRLERDIFQAAVVKAGVYDSGLPKINIVQRTAMELTAVKGTVAKIDIPIDTAYCKGAEIEYGVTAILPIREAVKCYPVKKGIAEKARRKAVFCRLIVKLLVDHFSPVVHFIAVLSIADFGVSMR